MSIGSSARSAQPSLNTHFGPMGQPRVVVLGPTVRLGRSWDGVGIFVKARLDDSMAQRDFAGMGWA
jgi:hypothetical protein